jgi:pyruvyltransferase
MNTIFDLLSYYKEWKKNYGLTKGLYWFKKHDGIKWIEGQNFGDYLSCIVVAEVARKLGLTKSNLTNGRKLLAVGSVLHFAQDGDIVWGAGVNGKIAPERHTFSSLDVRMVRGPKTREFLKQRRISVGTVFGDPALLLPILFPDFKRQTEPEKIIILPNLNELEILKKRPCRAMKLISPFGYWRTVLSEILTSELVLTSSLHGIILAESFGVPVRFVMPTGGETLFKYQDYYLGTGRSLETEPSSFIDGITTKSGVSMPEPLFDAEAIMEAFPVDVFA